MSRIMFDSITDGMSLTRRNLLKLCGASIGAYVSHCLPLRAVAKTSPNILFILSDDHRWDAMSCMRHPIIKTPHLDRLSSEGVHFKNAFVTTSLCSPSRASFLTGQYAHTHGVKNNLTVWNNENITFLEILKQAGYDTAFIGKWHMPGKGLPKLRGVDRFISFTIQEGQGRYFDCPLYIDGVLTERKGKYITDDLTDFAIEFIKTKRKNPFCLYLSHKAVHQLFLPPDDLKNLYNDVDVKQLLPEESDPWVTTVQGGTWAGTFGTLGHHYLNYCRTVVALDRQIGRILKALDESGISENTVVMYAGDNGYFWGEHRLIDKRWAYEEAIRIPFIIRYPGLIKNPGRKAYQMVLNIDLAPTLLDLAGIPIPSYTEGKSLKPIVLSGKASGRKAWLYEYFKEFPYNVPDICAVRTDSHIYIEYGGRRKPELYNVIDDPDERDNLLNTHNGLKLKPELKKLLEDLKMGKKYD